MLSKRLHGQVVSETWVSVVLTFWYLGDWMFILVSQPHWQTKHNANEGQDEIMHHTCTAHNSASECTRSLDYFSS